MTNQFQNIKSNEVYYEGFRVLYDRYPCIFEPTSKYARSNGIVNIHILQAVKLLGRDLKRGEVVHHVDENKWNYSLDNLWVFRSSADHTAFHQGVSAIKNSEGIYYCPILDVEYKCALCGKTLKKYSGVQNTKHCATCERKLRSLSSNKPGREELKHLLLCRNFLAIAKNKNVSDNSVRKWCKYYNLPHKTSELKQLTDEEILSL